MDRRVSFEECGDCLTGLFDTVVMFFMNFAFPNHSRQEIDKVNNECLDIVETKWTTQAKTICDTTSNLWCHYIINIQVIQLQEYN